MANGNAAAAFDYFVAKGLTPAQAAGIIGNLMQESSVNPASVQAGGPGRGIAQWSVGQRWQGVLQLAASQNQNPLDLHVQLDYLWQELNTTESGALSALKQTNDVVSATEAFERTYERAGIPDMNNRIRYAMDTLANGGAGAAALTSAPASLASSLSAPSAATAAGTVPDPADLMDFARVLDQRADAIVALNQQMSGRLAAASWSGQSATTFRAEAQQTSAVMVSDAESLRATASDLRILADQLQQELDQLRAIEDRVRTWFALNPPSPTAPPPPWPAANLPPTGDPRWRDVQRAFVAAGYL